MEVDHLKSLLTYRLYTKCRLCGKKVFSPRSPYCHDCFKIIRRMERKRFPIKARKGVRKYIHKYGFKCYYTGVALELDDDTSPWYCDFDHWIPGDPHKIVICAALVNDMKQDLSEMEFKYYVLALDDHRRKHTKVRKRKLIYWYRVIASEAKQSLNIRRCPICGRPTSSRWHKFCPGCSTVAKRLIAEHFSPKTKEGVFEYLRKYGYTCYYTGMKLGLYDQHDPWYLCFDHWIPNDPRKLVITSRMVNAMKQDLTEKEFWYIIHQLADHFRKGTPVRKIKLKYWSRPYRY